MSAFLDFIVPWIEDAGNDVFREGSTINSPQNGFSGINVRAILCPLYFSNALLTFHTPHKGYFHCFPGSFSYTKYNDLVMQLGISKNFKKKKESALTMRKQTKIAAVVSAAALLALGASITSFAASKGTWKYEDGEWYCYDKNGDVYENTFCLSNGKEFYVGDDGALVRSSWVESDGDYYFVNSAGEKITNDWRLTSPYDDENAEEQWFYFQSSGKRAEGKKLLIKGKTYFFNDEGEMLTGWVQESGDTWDEGSTDDVKNTDTYYCDETGARLESTWVYDYAPSVDRDDSGDEDEHHYYLKSSGKVATGKQSNIKGQTYFFDNTGKMLSGWVAKTDSDAGYVEIWKDDEEYTELNLAALSDDSVYFCGDEDDGHMKKNKWIKLWNNKMYGLEDDDEDKYWFYIEKNGEVYIPSASDTTVTKYKFVDGEGENVIGDVFEQNGDPIGVTEKKINGKTYLFDANGQMVSKFVMGSDNLMYYYGGSDEGDRKDGSLSIKDDAGESYRFYFATENKPSQGYYNAAGITGAKSGKLYDHGFLVKANDYKYELKDVTAKIDGVDTELSFIINSSGSIQTSDKKYEEDDDLLINTEGAVFHKESTNKGAAYGSVEGATALYR